jgi:hypothetical protein
MQGDRHGWTDIDDAIEEVARAQAGVFSRDQARDAGADTALIRRRLTAARWRRAAPDVFEFPGGREDWLRTVWITHLHAGVDSVISHRAAARLHGLGDLTAYPVDVIVGRNQTRALRHSRRHRVGDLAPGHVQRLDGLPVTRPARTLVDLAAVVDADLLVALLQDAHVQRICSVTSVAALFRSLRRPGKAGVRTMAAALDVVGPGPELTRSELEALLDPVIERAGLPEPRREHPLPGSGRSRAFVDRCWPEVKLIVEADGRRWHTRQADFQRDRQRDLAAARVGYHTLRLGWEDIHDRPGPTAAALREVYDQRRRLFGAA